MIPEKNQKYNFNNQRQNDKYSQLLAKVTLVLLF